MILFTLAAAIAYAALAGWTHLGGTAWTVPQPESVWAFVFGLPTLVTFVVADAVRLVRPKWTLDHRARRGLNAVAAGLMAGVVGAAAMSVVLASTVTLPVVLVLIACPAASTLLAVLPMRKLRAGWCVACGYDLRAATVRGGGCCPECGRVEG